MDSLAVGGYLSIIGLGFEPERAKTRDSLDLLFIDGIADRETFAALGAAAAQNGTTPAIFHAGTESVSIVALAVMGLECSFHSSKPLGNNELPWKNFWNTKDSKSLKFHKGRL